MATTAASDIQEKRLLRLTVAHYRKEDCAEEDLYRWATEVYTPQAVKIFTKYGLEGYVLVSDFQANILLPSSYDRVCSIFLANAQK